jgi:hypothetical protein
VGNQRIDRLQMVCITGDVISIKHDDVVPYARLRFSGRCQDGLVGGDAEEVDLSGDSIPFAPRLHKALDRFIPAGHKAVEEGDG